MKEFFRQKHARASLDTSSLTGPATWPTYSAQSYQTLPSQMHLLRHCWQKEDFALAEQAWLCVLLPRGTVFRRGQEETFWVSLGHSGFTNLFAWRLTEESFKNQRVL